MDRLRKAAGWIVEHKRMVSGAGVALIAIAGAVAPMVVKDAKVDTGKLTAQWTNGLERAAPALGAFAGGTNVTDGATNGPAGETHLP